LVIARELAMLVLMDRGCGLVYQLFTREQNVHSDSLSGDSTNLTNRDLTQLFA
jgi:hypothetical protein